MKRGLENLFPIALNPPVSGISGFFCAKFVGCIGVFLFALPGLAKSNSSKENPTVAMDVIYGLSSTYKSKYVNQNDTGTHFTLNLDARIGDARNLGLLVRRDSQTTPFKINTSKITSTWQDAIVRYFWGPFYLGVNISSLTLVANKEGTATIDAAGSGFGGSAGMLWNFSRDGLFYFDVTTAAISKTPNTLDLEVKGGARTDLDLGLGFRITKQYFTFLLGYKQRSFALSADSSYAESIITSYIGLRTETHF